MIPKRSLTKSMALILYSVGFVACLLLLVLVRHQMRAEALQDAEKLVRANMERNLAIHAYINTELKPKILRELGQYKDMSNFFDPVWMSSTFAVRWIDEHFQALNTQNYYYKEAAINARNQANEADQVERNFIQNLNSDPHLKEWSGVININNQPFFAYLYRGETMEDQCLLCHGDPQYAPADLIEFYGSDHSFGRHSGEIVSTLSVRVPLVAAFASADRFALQLSGMILLLLFLTSLVHWSVLRRMLVTPLKAITDKAVQIADDEKHLSEKLGEFKFKEMAELATAFNTMVDKLKIGRDNLERLVQQRTSELVVANQKLEKDVHEKKLAEDALRKANHFNDSIIQSINDSLAVIDPNDYRIILANKVFMKKHGVPGDRTIYGRTCYEIIHGLSAPCKNFKFECPLETTIKKIKTCTVEHSHYIDRKSVYEEISTSPITDSAGCVEQVVYISRDVTEKKKTEKRIMELAYFDAITGLPNRTFFLDRLNQVIKHSTRTNEEFAVLFLDLDRFKTINDSLGHSVGDELLKHVGKLLKKCVRESDVVARLSGDEFAILLGEVGQENDVAVFSQRLLNLFFEPFKLDEFQVYTSSSIGIALYPKDGENSEILLKRADTAMYAAKGRGRNNYKFYSTEMNAKALKRLDIETGLRRALQNDELLLCFQPQFNYEKMKVCGFEALIRWESPDKGMIQPGDFIPLAEESGLICEIDEWVLRRACIQGMEWKKGGVIFDRVSVNISTRQFTQPHFLSTIDQILTETNFDPTCLEFELTEGHLMNNQQEVLETLNNLKRRGIYLAIDDFGKGYSSLNYLHNFPIDRIKIDQSFVRNLSSDSNSRAIIKAIIALSESLGMEVIAEGVETKDQAEFLLSNNCVVMQGFLFARPQTVDEVSKFY